MHASSERKLEKIARSQISRPEVVADCALNCRLRPLAIAASAASSMPACFQEAGSRRFTARSRAGVAHRLQDEGGRSQWQKTDINGILLP